MSTPATDEQQLAAAGLLLHREGPVATITLHRPEVRNAQTPTMWRLLAAVGEELVSDDEVRVVVLRGSGSAFSAGLDRTMLDPPGAGDGVETVAALLAQSDEQVSATIDDYQRGFTWLRDPRILSIAAVHGYAIGAGFQLALSCDLRVLAEDAQLSVPTDEHYLPVLYIAAQQAAGEPVSFFNDSIDGGSISMTGVRIG